MIRKNKEREFVVSKDLIQVRLSSVLQHKLRLVMGCYTIVSFTKENDNWFTFKKTHRKRGVQFVDHNIWKGCYEISDIEGNDKEVLLKVVVNGNPL